MDEQKDHVEHDPVHTEATNIDIHKQIHSLLQALVAQQKSSLSTIQLLNDWRIFIELTPPGSTVQILYLHYLGLELQKRYAHEGDLIDLELAIKVWELALVQISADYSEKPSLLIAFPPKVIGNVVQ